MNDVHVSLTVNEKDNWLLLLQDYYLATGEYRGCRVSGPCLGLEGMAG